MILRKFYRHFTVLVVPVTALALLAACSDSDGACAMSSLENNVSAAFAGPTTPPRPRPPVVQSPRRTVPTAVPTRTTTKAATPTTVKPKTPAMQPPTTRTTQPGAIPTKPVGIKPGKVARKLAGEKLYYPVPVVKQDPTNVYLAQDAVRKQIEGTGRFTKKTTHYSPVTKRTYKYYDDDTYKKSGVPQDLYDPFDPRNWVHPYSPFYLQHLVIGNMLVADGPNVLNGDYLDDEGSENDEESDPSLVEPSPSNATNRC